METLRLLEVGSVNTREGEALREGLDLVPELLDLLVSNVVLSGGGGDTHEVLEELGAGLLLEGKRDLDGTVEELGDLLDVGLVHVTRGQGRGTETDTTRNLGRGVARNGVLCRIGLARGKPVNEAKRTVNGDAHEVADLLDLATSEANGAKIPEDEVVVSAAGLELVAVGNEGSSESPSVGDDLLGVLLPLGGCNLLQSSSNSSNGVVVGTTLACREDGIVNPLFEILGVLEILPEEDETGTGATQGLVGGGGNDVTVVEGAIELLGSNEAGGVGHITHEPSTLAVGDLAESIVLPVAGVSRSTTDNETGLVDLGGLVELLVVNEASLRYNGVRE